MRWISLLALTCVLFAASCSVEVDEFQKVSNSTADLTGVIAEYLSWNSSTAVWNEKTVETAQDYTASIENSLSNAQKDTRIYIEKYPDYASSSEGVKLVGRAIEALKPWVQSLKYQYQVIKTCVETTETDSNLMACLIPFGSENAVEFERLTNLVIEAFIDIEACGLSDDCDIELE